jgi:hypothetical protein
MYRMYKNAFAALLLAAAALAGNLVSAAPAGSDLRSPDAAIETSTQRVTIPKTVGGAVSARGCSSCQYLTLSVADGTRYFVGRQELSVDQYHKAVADGRKRQLTITYNQQTREITRVVLRAGSAQIPRR